jgi:Ca2+-binding RTX toxin-like protein
VVLTFTAPNLAQTIWVLAVDDSAREGERVALISHSINSLSPIYDDLAMTDVFVTIVDDDRPGLDIRQVDAGGAIDETTKVLEGGFSDVYRVALTVAPAADEVVTVTLLFDATQLSLSTSTLVFNAANWDVFQSVVVSAAQEPGPGVAENTLRSRITHRITSVDANLVDGDDRVYLVPESDFPTLDATVYDDESAAVIVLETGGETRVIQGGADDSYTIQLSKQPAGRVLVFLKTDGQTLLSTSPADPRFRTIGSELFEVTGGGSPGYDDPLLPGSLLSSQALAAAWKTLFAANVAGVNFSTATVEGIQARGTGEIIRWRVTAGARQFFIKKTDGDPAADPGSSEFQDRLEVTSDALLGTVIGPVEYLVEFNAVNWSDPIEVRVEANSDFVKAGGQPVKVFPPEAHRLNKIAGPLIVFGGPAPDRDRSLAQAIGLPGEDTEPSTAEGPITGEALEIDTLNIFHDDNTSALAADSTGQLLRRTDAGLENPGLALVGFGMGGDLTLDRGISGSPDLITFGGGVIYDAFEVVELLLGKADESLAISATADRSVTAVHGGGGSDTIVVTDRGEGLLIVYGDTSEDGVRYSNEAGDPSGNASFFNNPGGDVVDASALMEQGDAFVGLVIYGGPGADDLTGSQGDDPIAGGSGGDVISGQAGDDHLYGDSGFNLDLRRIAEDVVGAVLFTDPAAVRAMFAVPTGETAGEDEIRGDGDDDVVFGDHGIITQADLVRRWRTTGDVVRMETTNATEGAGDLLFGGAGNDFVLGGPGGDEIHGGNGSAGAPVAGADLDVILGDNGEVVLVLGGPELAAPFFLPAIRTTDVAEATGGDDVIEGNEDDDVILGGAGGDLIDGNDGDDLILGDNGEVLSLTYDVDGLAAIASIASEAAGTESLGGPDTIRGNAGNDVILGGAAGDDLSGGNGAAGPPVAGADFDLILGDNGEVLGLNTAVATPLSVATLRTTDTSEATGGADDVQGDEGDDVILGGVQGDFLRGDDGDDLVLGDNGELTAILYGAAGWGSVALVVTEILGPASALGGPDTASGDAGNDIVLGGAAGDFLFGGSGAAVPVAGADSDLVVGDNAVLTLLSRGLPFQVDELVTSDSTSATGGADVLEGNEDDDVLIGGVLADTINGDQADDLALGDNALLNWDGGLPVVVTTADPDLGGDDVMQGDAGDDVLIGGFGADRIDGDSARGSANQGNDVIVGDQALVLLWDVTDPASPPLGAGASVTTQRAYRIETIVRTNGGRDRIAAGPGEDLVVGGANADFLDGDAGDDLILGDNVLLDRSFRTGDFTNPRFRTLAAGTIYDGFGRVNPAIPGGPDRLDPRALGVWGDYELTLLDHSLADESAGLNNFGGDQIAGGTEDDLIFGQLGDDIIQGDGDVQVELDLAAMAPLVNALRDAAGFLQVLPSFETAADGDDYIEGNGGRDVIFGNLGRDDILGGSSSLFSLATPQQRPDGADRIFGGAGTRIGRNEFVGSGLGTVDDDDLIARADRHAQDADAIAGDNASIFRLLRADGSFHSFHYDLVDPDGPRGSLRVVPRAVDLLDYTPGGPDRPDLDPDPTYADIGAADEIHGESGDDLAYGMLGRDVLFGDSEDDDLVGGTGHDWASGGTGEDAILGDDGRISTSRNDANPEPLYGIAGIPGTELNKVIRTPGGLQQATINVANQLRKTADVEPFSADPDEPRADSSLTEADDILFGGLGDDFVHGGFGDDALSGAEALPRSVARIRIEDGDEDPANDQFLVFDLGFENPSNPGNVLGFGTERAGEFALYDEFDPLRRIQLDADDQVVKDPAAQPGPFREFLLNFNADEGPAVGAVSGVTFFSDGDDAVFGDLGNDWAVGGTGRDNLYGGRGDDLLNVDDDLSTNGGANDAPDTHPTYEDRAYGGAGRDVLIANTGGDRLVDWVGEFNSYLVPFAPFGAAAISRTLQPQLMEFLYDLSESDGADPTRVVDGDVARNGEPHGELGLVLQKDADWQAQTGAPDDPQAGNIPGGPRDVLRSANFNAGTADGFVPDVGVWSVANGRLEVGPAAVGGDAASVFYVDSFLPAYFELAASVNANKPLAGYKSNAFLIFDYQGPRDFKFAGVNVSIDKLQIGWRTEAGWQVLVQNNMQIRAGVDYNMLLAMNGTAVTLLVDNVKFLTYTFAPRVDADGFTYGLNAGMVGVGAENSFGRFDNVAAQVLPRRITFDKTDDFTPGSINLFGGFTSGDWQVIDGRYVAAQAPGGEPVMSLVDLGLDSGLNQSAVLRLRAAFRTERFGGLAFDQYSSRDYKFVALLPATDQVVLGHGTRRGGLVIDAAASRPLDTGVDYELEILLKGTSASVYLNGQVVLSRSYNALLVDGGFGLLSGEGVSSFDRLTVQTDDPALYGLRFSGRNGESATATSGESVSITTAATEPEEDTGTSDRPAASLGTAGTALPRLGAAGSERAGSPAAAAEPAAPAPAGGGAVRLGTSLDVRIGPGLDGRLGPSPARLAAPELSLAAAAKPAAGEPASWLLADAGGRGTAGPGARLGAALTGVSSAPRDVPLAREPLSPLGGANLDGVRAGDPAPSPAAERHDPEGPPADRSPSARWLLPAERAVGPRSRA